MAKLTWFSDNQSTTNTPGIELKGSWGTLAEQNELIESLHKEVTYLQYKLEVTKEELQEAQEASDKMYKRLSEARKEQVQRDKEYGSLKDHTKLMYFYLWAIHELGLSVPNSLLMRRIRTTVFNDYDLIQNISEELKDDMFETSVTKGRKAMHLYQYFMSNGFHEDITAIFGEYAVSPNEEEEEDAPV